MFASILLCTYYDTNNKFRCVIISFYGDTDDDDSSHSTLTTITNNNRYFVFMPFMYIH